jgi:hypothetical protein
MLKQCLENIGEGLLYACISSNKIYIFCNRYVPYAKGNRSNILAPNVGLPTGLGMELKQIFVEI